MNFKITNGLDIASIGVSEIGSYYSFHKPVSVEWDLYDGSVSKYSTLLPYSESYRKEVRDRIISNLDNDYTNNIEELYEILKPLFKLFKNGEYSLNYYDGKQNSFFPYWISGNDEGYKSDWWVAFNKITDINKLEEVINKYNIDKNNKGIYGSILYYTTGSFYLGTSTALIATQSKESINEERVHYFENEIKNGSRPAIIIFNCELAKEDLDSGDFIIDGHHKLLAYSNLNIEPPIIEIKYLPKSKKEAYYDIETLIEYLYPWQIQDIMDNWSGKEEYLSDAIKNPNSKIHDFIKSKI